MRVTLERMFTLIYSMQYRISLGLGPCMSKNSCGVIDYRHPSCAQDVTVQGCNSHAVFSGSMPLNSWDLGEAPVHLAFPEELATYPPAHEGYQDDRGAWCCWVARPELRESFLREGRRAERPYESVSFFFSFVFFFLSEVRA